VRFNIYLSVSRPRPRSDFPRSVHVAIFDKMITRLR